MISTPEHLGQALAREIRVRQQKVEKIREELAEIVEAITQKDLKLLEKYVGQISQEAGRRLPDISRLVQA